MATSGPVYVVNSFANPSVAGIRREQKDAIFLTPAKKNWNDFLLRTRFEFEIPDTKGELRHHSGYFGLLSDKDPRTEIEKLKEWKDPGWFDAGLLGDFYTMLPDLQSYRTIVETLGVSLSNASLRALNDLVEAQLSSSPPEWFETIKRSNTFSLSFTREAESFFAYHNAKSILKGLQFEEVTGIGTVYRWNFKLPAFENDHVIELQFEPGGVFPHRMAVLIGKNGVGKSQALYHFAKSMINGLDTITDAMGQRPVVNRLIAISSPGETINTFPESNEAKRTIYHRLHLGYVQKEDPSEDFGVTLVKLARSVDTIRARLRWEIFIDCISKVLRPDEVFIRTLIPSDPDDPTSNCLSISQMRAGGEQARLERWTRIDPKTDLFRIVDGQQFPLSSGQVTFCRFAAQACLYIENGTMLLIDEPETHLHPNLITEFVRLLEELLSFTGSLAVVATHSVYFVREVPRSQVIVLRATDESRIEVANPRLRTLGADVGEISHYVFGDALFGRLISRALDARQSSSTSNEAFMSEIEGELATEAWMNLRRILGSTQN